MNDILTYLLKVSAGLAIVGLPYYFLLRNDPNLLLKRFYLLLGMAASWIFPLIAFQRPELMLNLTPTVFIDPLAADMEAMPLGEALSSGQVLAGSEAGISLNWIKILLMTYLAGMAFMLTKNFVIIIKWNLEWKKRQQNGVAFIPSDQVFTLFTRIFIPEAMKEEQDLDNVILHERAHVEQLHFIDLMLMELTLLLTWFNPFSWLISRMIKENHEHLADRQVLSAGISAARYRAQLMNHTLGVNVFRLGNQFNHSLTLNRFKMMKKPEKSRSGIAKLTFLVPILLIAIALTTGMTPQEKQTVNGIVIEAESGDFMHGTSIVVKGGTLGTVVDRDGSFSITVPGDPDLVFSFVGYKTQVVKASKIGRKPIKLKAKTYEIDLESVPMKREKEAFFVVDEMPTFNGGEPTQEFRKYIAENLQYPEIAVEKGLSGRVIVQFTVNESGKVVDAMIVRKVDPALDKEALRVVNSSPEWTPGKNNGKPAKVLFTFPVNYVLNNTPPGITGTSEAGVIIRSENSGKDPLFVLDGKVIDHIDNIDPKSIESVSVIKGPDSEELKKYNAPNGLVLITSKKAAKVKKEEAEEVFFVVEDMPRFPGGKPALKTYIYSRLEYPDKLKKKEIEGQVNIQFQVNTEGELKNIKAVSSSNREFEAPALEVFKKMPAWKPGKQRGKPVAVMIIIPVVFSLDKK